MNSTIIHEQILEEEEKRNRVTSIIVTLVVHALILLLLWQLVFTGNPPLREEAGIPVDFGTSEVGSGEEIPTSATMLAQQQPNQSQPQEATPPPVAAQNANDNNIATQENEEAPVVKTVEKKKEVKPVKEITHDQPVKEIKKEAPPVVKPEPPKQELAKGTTMGKPTGVNKPGSNGNDAPGTQGDKGVPWGSQSKDNFKGNDGKGDHGTGTGAKDTKGPYPMKYQLQGRSLIFKPNLTGYIQETGTVVLTITVDKKGNVINADCCAQGTTSKSPVLVNKALEDVKKVKFDANVDAQDQQIGTITFTFKLQ